VLQKILRVPENFSYSQVVTFLHCGARLFLTLLIVCSCLFRTNEANAAPEEINSHRQNHCVCLYQSTLCQEITLWRLRLGIEIVAGTDPA